MSGKIVNLGRVRKDRARSQKAAQADANAVKFGRTKAEKKAQDAKRERAKRDLDGKKRDP